MTLHDCPECRTGDFSLLIETLDHATVLTYNVHFTEEEYERLREAIDRLNQSVDTVGL
jgi:hypothetical protein